MSAPEAEIALSGRENIDHLYDKAWEIRENHFDNEITFFSPSFSYSKSLEGKVKGRPFPSISVTGKNCSLNCKHCNGKILESMITVSNPRDLLAFSYELSEKGGVGFLLSGGCSPKGSVPLERYLETLRIIKENTDLFIVVHTGLLDLENAKRLSETGIDCVSIDIIGDDKTIRDIYGLDSSVEDYRLSISFLKRYKIKFMPHILIGLHYGEIIGEYKAVRMISKYDPAALIFIVFTPIRNTPMQHIPPPSPSEVSKVILYSRIELPRTPITLGCVRPKHPHRAYTDILGIKSGVNGVAFPSSEAVRFADERGLHISYSPYCCTHIS